MAINTRKPRNASLRAQTFLDTKHLTKKDPERSLVVSLPKSGGRNAYGRITVRYRGGGAQKKYRLVDFARIERNIPGKVAAVEYDPNRNVPIALVHFKNGVKRYILTPQGLKVGHEVMAGVDIEAKVGNCLPLRSIPVGFTIHNVEMTPGAGGKLARSAGSSIQVVAKDDQYATLRMPSSEVRKLHLDCWATVGELSNADFKNITIGKAGRNRHLGFRPHVRGMAMNPIDHPHGGGEGRSKSGSHPMTPWGKPTKGKRTRTRKNSLIISRRKA